MPTNVPSQGISFLENLDMISVMNFISWKFSFSSRNLGLIISYPDYSAEPIVQWMSSKIPLGPSQRQHIHQTQNNAPCEKGMCSPNALPLDKVRKLWTQAQVIVTKYSVEMCSSLMLLHFCKVKDMWGPESPISLLTKYSIHYSLQVFLLWDVTTDSLPREVTI